MGLAVEDLRDDVFNPPEGSGAPGPPVCPYHPTFVTRSAAGLHPVPVHGEEVVLWRGRYQLELAKAERKDGDALVQWAIGGFLPPERPASCWQLLNEAPPFRHARQAKKGGWSIRSPCEVEVWCVLCVAEPEIRAIFARLCHPCALCSPFATCFPFAHFARKSRDFRAIFSCYSSVCSFVIVVRL